MLDSPITLSRIRTTTSANAAVPDRSVRILPTPWKQPISPSTSACRRPLSVVLSTTSVTPPARLNRACTAATVTTNTVL
jgi:hypothetical protein